MSSSPIPTFVQNSRVGRTVFQVKDEILLVSELGGAPGCTDREIPLRTIDPNYEPRAARLQSLLIGPAIMAVASFLAAWAVMRLNSAAQGVLPGGLLFHLAVWPSLIFAASMARAIRGSRRVEYFVFHDHWRKPAFAIVCEREQREECSSFIAALVAAVEAAQAELSTEARTQVLRDVEKECRATEQKPDAAAKWRLSLICGASAAGMPWIPGLAQHFWEEPIVIVLALSVGAVAFSYYSFAQREKRRWWSLLGAGLAVVPIAFY